MLTTAKRLVCASLISCDNEAYLCIDFPSVLPAKLRTSSPPGRLKRSHDRLCPAQHGFFRQPPTHDFHYIASLKSDPGATDQQVRHTESSPTQCMTHQTQHMNAVDAHHTVLFPHQHNSVGRVLRQLKKEDSSLFNCACSVSNDASFVEEVSKLYPHLPVVANLRCGLWYVRQGDPTCYFKSTDGHNGNWSFSTTRLNLHVAELAAAKGGCIIVDATRRGKTFPVFDLHTCTKVLQCMPLKPDWTSCFYWYRML